MTTKDTLANVASVGGLTLTMVDAQMIISFLVLCTALFLNVSRLYALWVKRKAKRG
tara:strand:+ start:947 stop:1114 length:168 start_codon:yes stop_codon:yes gene_type:complete